MGQSQGSDQSAQVCECENPDRGLFIWRGDPDWASCVQCDGRVRPLTEAEKVKASSERQQEARRAAKTRTTRRLYG